MPTRIAPESGDAELDHFLRHRFVKKQPTKSLPFFNVVQPTFASTGASPFALIKERVQCACEGGRRCRREDPKYLRGAPAVEGVHSSWVGEGRRLIAMARPNGIGKSAEVLMANLKVANVGAVVNLQQVGEHSACGPGVLPHTGFSYDPEQLMDHGISCYNFSWRDMTTPPMQLVFAVVNIITHHVVHRKHAAAVHCHAGLGRTGLVLACYLVYAEGTEPSDAVKIVRKGRPGALQTKGQVNFVHEFADAYAYRRVAAAFPERGTLSLPEAINLQRDLLHGDHVKHIMDAPRGLVEAVLALRNRLKLCSDDAILASTAICGHSAWISIGKEARDEANQGNWDVLRHSDGAAIGECLVAALVAYSPPILSAASWLRWPSIRNEQCEAASSEEVRRALLTLTSPARMCIALACDVVSLLSSNGGDKVLCALARALTDGDEHATLAAMRIMRTLMEDGTSERGARLTALERELTSFDTPGSSDAAPTSLLSTSTSPPREGARAELPPLLAP